MRSLLRLSVLASLSLVVSTCGDGGSGPTGPAGGFPSKLAFTVPPSAATAGAVLSPALQVTVQDAQGNPVTSSTASITLALTSGTGTAGALLGGTLTRAAVNGVATFSDLTLDKAGVGYTLTATASALTSATSNAFAVSAAAATSVAKQAGDGQSAPVGSPVATPPAVIVKDAFNNPKPGASVTFAVASGGGTITGANQTTDAGGIAAVGSWTLGAAGTNTLTATVSGSGISGNPVTFTATATIVAANVAVFVGNNQSGLVGYAVNIRPAVRVTDGVGGPVSGQSVTFAVASGGGSVTSATVNTNSNGVAQVGSWVLGAAGANTLTATVSGAGIAGNPLTFTATGNDRKSTRLNSSHSRASRMPSSA